LLLCDDLFVIFIILILSLFLLSPAAQFERIIVLLVVVGLSLLNEYSLLVIMESQAGQWASLHCHTPAILERRYSSRDKWRLKGRGVHVLGVKELGKEARVT
jgi:hypothetical protein